MKAKVFHLQALTALHVGTGQGVGVVDLPIARSKATHLPIVPGSGIKGVMRDEFPMPENYEGDFKKLKNTLFGPWSMDETSFAGSLMFSDANLLILPIRSFAGTVAYATCPFILKRYARDLGISLPILSLQGIEAAVTSETVLEVSNNKIALEDLDIDSNYTDSVDDWADTVAEMLYPESTANYQDWRNAFKNRFVILPDDIFSFLVDTATEIRTRIRIDRDTRMVQKGALWSEENLPAESILWGVLGINQSFNTEKTATAKELIQYLPTQEMNIQLGGKYTVGRGLCRLLINNKGE